MSELKEGDLIQITNEQNPWFPCVLVVSEIKAFGAQAYVTMPKQGNAYYRINSEDFEKVGEALVVAE